MGRCAFFFRKAANACVVAALLPLSSVRQAGNKDEGLMFLLTDSQITNERFLIYINDLLASGNIPDLFAVDEVDSIVSKLRGALPADGRMVVGSVVVVGPVCIPRTPFKGTIRCRAYPEQHKLRLRR